ncbi:hypothetical protein [Paenibacillus sp. 1A_MP2]|uniref:hypothetical protein n=1 Tax=Paenibacillus sp. 1A_MP2 TaxID=3457495 RepID=UPI003FCCB292
MTKAYSLRIDPEIDYVENELALILDALDSDESGLLQSDQWLREAARRRVLADQESNIIKAENEMLVPAQTKHVQTVQLDGMVELDEEVPIENSLKTALLKMDSQERLKWIMQAAVMRFAIEANAYTYFVDQWQTNSVPEVAAAVTVEVKEVESIKVDSDIVPVEDEKMVEVAEDMKPFEEDELTPYRHALSVMVEEFYD